MFLCSDFESKIDGFFSLLFFQFFLRLFIFINNKRNNELISPINAPYNHIKDLPPVLIITDENDVLRDDGEAFAHKLMKASVDVTAVRYL